MISTHYDRIGQNVHVYAVSTIHHGCYSSWDFLGVRFVRASFEALYDLDADVAEAVCHTPKSPLAVDIGLCYR